MAAAQVPALLRCNVCDSSEEVNWFCQDCQDRLCNRCKISHQGGRKTKNDEIVPITERKDRTTSKIVPVLCHEHKTKLCEFYCEKCEQLICCQCFDKNHKTHAFSSVEKLIESKTSEFDELRKRLYTKFSSFESVLSEESKHHSDFISHVEKLKVEVKNETDKVIQEFSQSRDNHISQLNQLKKKAEQRYQTNCNNYQTKTSQIQKTVHAITSAEESGSADIMIRTAKEIKRECSSLEVPTALKIPLPILLHNACQPSFMLQLDIPNTEVVPTLDLNKVRVGVQFQVKLKSGQIRAIILSDINLMWVAVYPDHHLTLVDTEGNTMTISVDVGGEIYDAVSYFSDVLVTIYTGRCIMRVRKDGTSVTRFRDVSPFYTLGLCVTSNKDILLSVLSSLESYSDTGSKIIRLNGKGEITHDISHNKNEPMFSRPAVVTSLDSEHIVVIDRVSNDVHRLICTDRSGNHIYTWTGHIGKRKGENIFLSRTAAHNNSVYVTDKNNHCVYVLDRNSKAKVFMLKKPHQIENPVAITIDNRGQLWLGCRDAKIYMLK